MDENIICLCGDEFTQKDFKKHFFSCNDFRERFSIFDSKMTMLLKSNSNSKEQLLFIQFLLKRYIKLISTKLNECYGYKNRKCDNEINNYNYCSNNQNFFKDNNNKIIEVNKKFDKKAETKMDKTTTTNDITNRSAAFLPAALSDDNYLKKQDSAKDDNYIENFKKKYQEIIIELQNLFSNDITEEESREIISKIISDPCLTIFEAMNFIYREVEIIKTLKINNYIKDKNKDKEKNEYYLKKEKDYTKVMDNYKIYKQNNNLEKYYLYIDNTDKRRQIKKDPTGYYNYLPVIKLKNNNGIFAKNENEMLYHSLFYKTKICKYCDLSNEENSENDLCPYSHNILKDFRIIYNYKDKNVLKFMLLLKKSKLFKFKNYLNYIPMDLSPEFNIDSFKIHECFLNENCESDYHICPYYHKNNPKDKQRRPLFIFRYDCELGEKCFDNNNKEYYPNKCDLGIFCPNLHSKNEYNYYPDIFKKNKCERKIKDGKCEYYKTCYGFHFDNKTIIKFFRCKKCQNTSIGGDIYYFIECNHFLCADCYIKNEKKLSCPFCGKDSKKKDIVILRPFQKDS